MVPTGILMFVAIIRKLDDNIEDERTRMKASTERPT